MHATVLHILGLDHKRLTYLYGGRAFRLTDVAGNVAEKFSPEPLAGVYWLPLPRFGGGDRKMNRRSFFATTARPGPR